MFGFLISAVKDLEEREKFLQEDIALITTAVKTLKEFYDGDKELHFSELFHIGFILGAAAQAQYLLERQKLLFHKEDILHIKEMSKRVGGVITYQDCEDIRYLNKTFSKNYENFLNYVENTNENYIFLKKEKNGHANQILSAGIEKGIVSTTNKVLESLKE